jgi:hypothetical protein
MDGGLVSKIEHIYRGSDKYPGVPNDSVFNKLRAGIEVIHHYHDDVYMGELYAHPFCVMYVLDWHDELPYCRYKQTAVIFPPVDLVKHPPHTELWISADGKIVETMIEPARR